MNQLLRGSSERTRTDGSVRDSASSNTRCDIFQSQRQERVRAITRFPLLRSIFTADHGEISTPPLRKHRGPLRNIEFLHSTRQGRSFSDAFEH